MKGILLALFVCCASSVFASLPTARVSSGDVTTIYTKLGAFSVMEKWSVDPDPGMSSQDVLAAHVSFLPNPNTFPQCHKLALIQVAQVLGNDIGSQNGQQYVWSGGQTNRNFIETIGDPVNNIEPGFFVDHDASKCAPHMPCSPYFLDSWPSFPPPNIPSHYGYVLGLHKFKSTSLTDYPNHWDEVIQYKFETCVVCADRRTLYQCVNWGGYRPSWGPLPLKFKIFRPKVAHVPSPTFLRALKLFEKFYSLASDVLPI